MLKYHINRFLNKTNLPSNFLVVQTKLVEDKYEGPGLDLGNNFYINIKRPGEKNFYIDYLIGHYNKINNKDLAKFKLIVFTYKTTSEKDVENFIENYKI